MALDNPSYFSSFGLPRMSLFRRKRKDSTSSESSAAPSTPGYNKTNASTEYLYDSHYQPPTFYSSSSRRQRAPLARSALALLTGGEPRPEDREPDSSLWPNSDQESSDGRRRAGSLPGRNRGRRHSISSFSKNRTTSTSSSDYLVTSVPDGAPKKSAPRVPRSQLARMIQDSKTTIEDLPFRQRLKAVMANHDPNGIVMSRPDVVPRDSFRYRRPRGAYGRLAMDDILLLSSKDSNAASLWVDYLTTCFDHITRGKANSAKIRVFPFYAEDLPATPCPELVRRIRSAKLLLIVLCPRLLQRCSEKTEDKCDSSSEVDLCDVSDGMNSFTARISADRVIAAMLGVKNGDVKEQHKKALTSYDHWTRLEVRDQDQNFVGCLLNTSMSIIGRPGGSCANIQDDLPTNPGRDQVDCPMVDPNEMTMVQEDGGKAGFSVQPKKVRYGQSRILALLNDPVTSQDCVEVFVEKSESGEMVRAQQIRKRNPYTVQFTVPDLCMTESCLLSIQLRINGKSMGSRPIKCEARCREFERILRECLDRPDGLWGLLGLPGNLQDRDRLDAALCRALRENIPQDFQLLAGPGVDDLGCTGILPECPSLLHFCARYGLERTAMRLLDCPGGGFSGTTLDASGRSPAELASQNGHHRLASILQGYMQMNELSSMYAYLKGISGNRRVSSRNSESQEDAMGYLDMTTNSRRSKKDSINLNVDNDNTDDSMSEQCCRLLEEDGPRATSDALTSEEVGKQYINLCGCSWCRCY
ncbi:uncharacterized protein LOC113389755 [Ctenocephalides felis]|uniref:uncharacterized protein LOC113389755 n=1 Tax=Ctenocephalides felis TaxID=7515 RepID=UPI000E6E40EE|nr:uncharacterized protein LOC113389755 [Ctenocephalides felis]